MASISRAGAFAVSFVLFLVPLYCGSLWLAWPCRQTVVGRELRQTNLVRQESPCKDASSVFLTVEPSGALTQENVVEASHQSPDPTEPAHTPAPTPLVPFDQDAFLNPFPDDSFKSAMKKGAAYHDELTECTKKDWDVVNGGYIGAYHKYERQQTAKAIVADPAHAENTKICPKSAEETKEFNAVAEKSQHDNDDLVEALKAYMGDQGDDSDSDTSDRDAVAAVHFADVEDSIREILGKPKYPMTPEFIGTNWVPIVNKMFNDMKSQYSLENGMTLPAVHTFLTMDQLEKVREEKKR